MAITRGCSEEDWPADPRLDDAAGFDELTAFINSIIVAVRGFPYENDIISRGYMHNGLRDGFAHSGTLA